MALAATEKFELFPYQVEGAKWLSTRRTAILADEMGLGKSCQAITAADLAQAKNVLVLCPASARVNWVREFEKFSNYPPENSPRSFTVLFDRKTEILPGNSAVASYDIAAACPEKFSRPWDLMILDEVHFLKSAEAKRTHAVLGKEGIVRHAARIWAITGTPAPNNASELWPLLFTFGVTTLSFEKWVERFCNSYSYQGRRQISGTKMSRVGEVKALLKPHMLRRMKDEVMKELPPIFFQQMFVEPGIVEIELEASFTHWIYPEDRKQELFDKLKKEEELVEATIGHAGLGREGMMALEALATSVSTLRRYIGLQKVPPVAEMIADELERNAYEKVVIFAIHRDVIEGLRTRLAKFGAVTLYGGTEPDKRHRNIQRFQTNPKCRVFIGNITAAGTAITLTAAHNVVFVEQDWVPGNNAQAAMRCHRIGQKKPVTVRFVGVADSIDEHIAETLRRKVKELTALIDETRSQYSPPTEFNEIKEEEIDIWS